MEEFLAFLKVIDTWIRWRSYRNSIKKWNRFFKFFL